MKIIVATNNQGKMKEIREILLDIELVSLKELGISIDIEENEETFAKNSLKKATEIARITKMPSIADDSGLCIEILNGFPGVKTNRFLGENISDKEKNKYLLDQLKEKINKADRKAKVITAIAYVDNKGKKEIFQGELDGYISQNARGTNGFGFDEIFELEDGRTLAELENTEKNEISSRKKALIKLKNFLTYVP